MRDDEKMPLTGQVPVPNYRASTRRTCIYFLFTLTLLSWHISLYYGLIPIPHLYKHRKGKHNAQCPQVGPLLLQHSSPALDHMEQYLTTDSFVKESVERLSEAIQIPTESYDGMNSVDDPRFDIFYDFSAYLEATFPLVHRTLKLEKINRHGLLYTWQGTDPSLKPTVLMAHQDVVPVANATRNQWTHDAFSGFYDGTYIWGRGAFDCKNTLIGILEAVDLLIEAGFAPKRTVVLSFGFDEEISGYLGAARLSDTLINRYQSVGGAAVIVDEGGSLAELFGTTFAVPGLAEKGYIDVEVVVRMPGGHSSIPPAHSGIGVASELITSIEVEAYEPRLHAENPFLGLMQCGAEYSPKFPKKLKKLLPSSVESHRSKKHKDHLAEEAAKLGGPIKYLFTTSQAVDIIDGGVKINALPERTRFLINQRVNVGESTLVVKDRLTKLASAIAQKYDLTLHAFTNATETPSSITLSAFGEPLEPAPVTPSLIKTSGGATTPYAVLSATIKSIYNDTNIVVAPSLMTGNTDTKFYWGLSKHIFRYGPGWDANDKGNSFQGIHTVDERVRVADHVRAVVWYTRFVRGMDEAEF